MNPCEAILEKHRPTLERKGILPQRAVGVAGTGLTKEEVRRLTRRNGNRSNSTWAEPKTMPAHIKRKLEDTMKDEWITIKSHMGVKAGSEVTYNPKGGTISLSPAALEKCADMGIKLKAGDRFVVQVNKGAKAIRLTPAESGMKLTASVNCSRLSIKSNALKELFPAPLAMAVALSAAVPNKKVIEIRTVS